jgi:hypothetical protein
MRLDDASVVIAKRHAATHNCFLFIDRTPSEIEVEKWSVYI